jgi:hypothetical protein
LTFAAGRRVSQGAVGSNVHGITVGGELGLPSGATYVVESAANKVGTLTIDASAVLTLGAGVLAGSDASNTTTIDTRSSLVLTAVDTHGAILTGAGKVVAGGTEIVGGTNGWTAGGASGAVTIEADSISADATSVEFAAVTGAADAVITVAEAATLTIGENTIVNLLGERAAVGSIVLTGAASGTEGGTLAFAQGTTSVVMTGNSDSTAGTNGIANATIGDGLTLANTGSENYYLVSITSQDEATGRTIQATEEGANVTLAGNTVAATG